MNRNLLTPDDEGHYGSRDLPAGPGPRTAISPPDSTPLIDAAVRHGRGGNPSAFLSFAARKASVRLLWLPCWERKRVRHPAPLLQSRLDLCLRFRTLPRRRSVVSTFIWSARRRRWRPSTTSRRWRSGSTRICRSRSARPASDDHDERAIAFSDRAVHLQVCAARQIRRLGVRVAAVHGKDGGRHRIIRSMHTEAINHEPAITFFQTGLDDCRPAVPRVLAELWTGQHESRICPHLSCCRRSTTIRRRACRRSRRGCGVPGFFPASTPA